MQGDARAAFDAAAQSDVGAAGDAWSSPDAAAFDAWSAGPDAWSPAPDAHVVPDAYVLPDAYLPPDAYVAPVDSGPAPCDTTFGGAASYSSCPTSTGACTFAARLNGGSCVTVCGSHSCLHEFDSSGAGGCTAGTEDPCGTTHSGTHICVCAQ